MKLTKISLAAKENIFKKTMRKPNQFWEGSKSRTECSSSNDQKLWQRSVQHRFQRQFYLDSSVWLSLFTPPKEF